MAPVVAPLHLLHCLLVLDGVSRPLLTAEPLKAALEALSTVGTVTEIYDYIRALYATIGSQHCPRCQVAVGAQTAQEMVDRILNMPEGRRILVLAPIEPRRL